MLRCLLLTVVVLLDDVIGQSLCLSSSLLKCLCLTQTVFLSGGLLSHQISYFILFYSTPLEHHKKGIIQLAGIFTFSVSFSLSEGLLWMCASATSKENHLWFFHTGSMPVLRHPSCPFLFSLPYFLSFILLLCFFKPGWCQPRNKLDVKGVEVCVFLLVFTYCCEQLFDF